MFGLGGWEIALLGMAALVMFGPKKLPQLMRQAGKIMREVRKASWEFQTSLQREIDDDEFRKAHRREKKRKKKAEELGVSPEDLDPSKQAPADASSAGGGDAASANGSGNGNGAIPHEAVPPEAATSPAGPAPSDDEPKSGLG